MTHQSFVILSSSPVTSSEAAAQANCQKDEGGGEDDVAGVAEETGTDQSAVYVLDAGILPLVWTDVRTGLDCHVDPQETVSQHGVRAGLDIEIICSVLSYLSALSLPLVKYITVITDWAVLPRAPDAETGAVDVGVGQLGGDLPV